MIWERRDLIEVPCVKKTHGRRRSIWRGKKEAAAVRSGEEEAAAVRRGEEKYMELS